MLSILLHAAIGVLFLGHWGLTTRHEPPPERVMMVETVRPAPPKVEPPKPEPPKPEPPKPEPPRAQPQEPAAPTADAPEPAPPPVRPPPPQLQRGKPAEKSSAPRQGPPSPPPVASGTASDPAGIAPPQDWATNYRSREWVEATLNKVGPVTQSEHDWLLSQITAMLRRDAHGSAVPDDLTGTLIVLVLPNGELGSPINKNDPFRPETFWAGYDRMSPEVRRTAYNFYLAIRMAQPMKLPPREAGYWPRYMRFQFRVADVMPR